MASASSPPADPAFALVRTPLRRSSTSCSPFRGSLLVATHRAPARPLSLASQLHAQARLVVAFCACALPHHTRRDPTPRVLQQWLFLNPASKLDAGGSHGVSLPHTPLPFANTDNTRAFDLYHLVPVSSLLCTSLSMPSTICNCQPAIASLCFPARSHLCGMAAS